MIAATLVALTSAGGSPEAQSWDDIGDRLDKFPLDDFCFSVGDASERLFEYCKGNMTFTQELFLASSSKFPTAAAIMGVVADPSNTLSLSSKASDFLPYWTTDPADKRSGVTLRSLLTFTSGFFSASSGGATPCMSSNTSLFDPCIKEIYEQADFEFTPGTTWDYNSFHLQVAGGMATAASKLTMIEILEQNLIKKLGMTGSKYQNRLNPSLAAGLSSTGDDYEKFLRAYLTHAIVTPQLATEIEKDAITSSVTPSNSSAMLLKILGHYGMAHYFQCLPPKKEAFTPECLADDVHADPGLFGYWPLIDRKNNYYLQIVQEKFTTNLLPTVKASILLSLIKPDIDAIIVGGPRAPSPFATHQEAMAAYVAEHPDVSLKDLYK